LRNKSLRKRFNLFLSLILALVVVIPAVNAAVVINEVMYQFSGTDADREWIEVYNSGPGLVNIAGWRLNEAGVDHNLNLVSGSSTLYSGDYAVIVDDDVMFLTEHPGFTGNVFDSTFSLADAGEQLILRNAALADMDTVNYSSAWGSLGDYSLELRNSGLDNNLGASWGLSTVRFGTPGAENSIYQDALEILDVFHTPENPTIGDNVEVCAVVDNLLPLQDILLYWNSDIGSSTVRLYDFDGDGTYCRTLSADTMDPYDGLNVDYYVTVQDQNGNFVSTEGDPGQSWTYDGAAPVADFICNPTTGVEPLTVICDSTSTDSVASLAELEHDWMFNGGIPGVSSALSQEVDFITQGFYRITLTVTDPSGQSDREIKLNYIQVDDSTPVADFDWLPFLPSDHQRVSFDGRGSETLSYDNIARYCWDFDDGSADVCDRDSACTGALGSCATVDHTFEASGNYDVTLSVTDVDGPEVGTLTQTVQIAYTDDAPQVGDIPDQEIDEGEEFTTFDLDNYLTELDGEDIIWTYGGNVDLIVDIDANNVVTVSTLNQDWNGQETITFEATDVSAENLFDSDFATFTVNPVNDAPVVGDIPDQTINEGEAFTTFDLDDYLTEVDGEGVTWSSNGEDQLVVEMDPVTNVVTIVVPSAEWDGAEIITFTATDDTLPLAEALFDSDEATFTVNGLNDAPTLSIPDDSVEEDSGLTSYDLADYAADAEDSDNLLTFTLDSETNPGVINCGLNGQTLECRTVADQNGQSTVTVTVYDTEAGEDEDSFTITVTAVNDAPVANNDAAETSEETMVAISIIGLLANDNDVEDDTLTLIDITAPGQGTAVINGGNIEYTPETDFSGVDTFDYTIDDGNGGSDTATVTVTVTNANDAPVLGLPGIIPEMTENVLYTLTFTASDPDEDVLTITGDVEAGILENLNNLQFTDNEDGTWDLTFTPGFGLVEHTDRSREFEITIILNDGLTEVEQTFSVTANDVNRAPVITNIGTIEFSELVAGNYQVTANDPDGDGLTYVLIDDPAGMTIGATGLISWTPALGQEDVEDITVRVSDRPYLPILPGDSRTAEVRFDVDVRRAFEISRVRVNNIAVEEGEPSAALRPAQEAEIEISLTNSLNHPITGVSVEFDSAILDLASAGPISLGGRETETVTLRGVIPYTVIQGDYNALITASGDDYEVAGLTYDDSFDFLLNIDQNPAEIIITELELADEELICKDSTDLTFQLINVGSQNEDDVFVTVTTPSGLELAEGPLIINQNTFQDLAFQIPSEELASGNNPITVEVSYRGNTETVTDDSLEIAKNDCLNSYTPAESELIIADCVDQEFTVELSEDNFDSIVHWYIDEVEVGTGLSYTFNECEPGVYSVEVIVDADGQETNDWAVTVTDVPISDNMDISTDPFVLENQYARVEYDEQPDLGDLVDIDAVARLTEGQVAIDGITAEELEGAATITIKKNYLNPIILISTGFGSGTFIECPTAVCRVTSNPGGWPVFEVDGFSTYRTYRVEEEVAPAVDISEISFNQVNRGATAIVNVVVTNLGTHEMLTGLSSALENVAAGYNARVIGSLPATLAARAAAAVQIQIDVPENEVGGRHSIGNFRVTSNEDTDIEAIYLSARSFLTIESVEINGDENGDLKIDEENQFEVTLQNGYTQDLEDVEVTVTILDVDGEDLDETADEQDIGAGKDEEFTVGIDLSSEELDEEEYTILIQAEGIAEDGTRHEASETITAKLDLENHKVAIDRAELTFNTLQCSRQTGLRVTVENIGKSEEDDLELKVKNSALKMDLSRTGIEVDEFTEEDNKETEVFHFNLAGAEAGQYPLSVELYRDGDLEDTATVDMRVMDCLEVQAVSQTQQIQPTSAAEDLADQLRDQLQQQLYGQLYLAPTTETVTTTVKAGGFRDSATYLIILGSLIFLVFIGILMALAVMLTKNGRKRKDN